VVPAPPSAAAPKFLRKISAQDLRKISVQLDSVSVDFNLFPRRGQQLVNVDVLRIWRWRGRDHGHLLSGGCFRASRRVNQLGSESTAERRLQNTNDSLVGLDLVPFLRFFIFRHLLRRNRGRAMPFERVRLHRSRARGRMSRLPYRVRTNAMLQMPTLSREPFTYADANNTMSLGPARWVGAADLGESLWCMETRRPAPSTGQALHSSSSWLPFHASGALPGIF
jgi:hypothetical protein